MRICSRCNNEVGKADIVCKRCGASLVKDKYGRRVEHKVAYSVDPNSELGKKVTKIFNFSDTDLSKGKISIRPQNNVAGIAVFIIIITATIIPAIMIGIRSNIEKKVFDDFNNFSGEEIIVDIDRVNSYLEDAKTITSDYSIAWKDYIENNNITLKEISNDISLKENDMNDDTCVNFKNNHLEIDLLDCIINSHEKKGTYEKADSNMISLYKYSIIINNEEVKEIINDIYDYTYILYSLPGNYDNYELYQNDYKSNLNNINELLIELNDINDNI